MKFLELQLAPYGHFESLTLDFGGEGKTFHFVIGANEAGKSTTLRAVSGFLYGIPARTNDSFLFGNSDLRIKARITSKASGERSLVRRKGNKNTVLDWDNNQVDAAVISECMGNLDERLFSNMFGLTHTSLVEGGRGLLAAGGDLSETLFQAGTGVAPLRKTLAKLDADSQALFSPNARNKSAGYNAAKDRYDQATQLASTKSTLAKTYTDLDKEFKDKSNKASRSQLDIQNRSVQKRRFERLRDALPHYARWNMLQAELQALNDVVLVPESSKAEREAAQTALEKGEVDRAKLQTAIESCKSRIAEIVVSEDLLGRGEEIDKLYVELGSVQKAAIDIPKVQQEQKRYEDEARKLHQETGSTLTLDQIEAAQPTEEQRKQIREFIATSTGIAYQVSTLRDQIERAGNRIDSERTQLATLPKPVDTASVIATLEVAERSAHLDAAIVQETAKADRQWAEAELSAKQLTLWYGTIEALEALAVPDAKTIERFDKLFRDLESREAAVRLRATDIDKRRQELEDAISSHLRSGEIPTEDDVHASRAHRDSGWALVRNAWRDGLSPEAIRDSFNADLPLADAYYQSVLSADALGDRLRSDASRVAEYASMLKDRQNVQESAGKLQDEAEALTAERTALQTLWLDVWNPLSIAPLPPVEMLSWKARHASIVDTLANHRQLRSAVQVLVTERDSHRFGLEKALKSIGVVEDAGIHTLSSLVGLASRKLEKLDAVESEHNEVQARIRDLIRTVDENSLKLEQLLRDRADWTSEWGKTMQLIGQPPTLSPVETEAILERLARLHTAQFNAGQHKMRVDNMKQDARLFATAVQSIAKSVAPDLLAETAETAIVQLAARLRRMQSDQIRQDELKESLRLSSEAFADCQATIQQAGIKLNLLLARAHCETVEQLILVEEKSQAKRLLTDRLAQAEELMSQSALGSSLTEFTAQLSETDPDQVEGQIIDLDQKINAETEQLNLLNQEIGTLRFRMEEIDGGNAAAEAAMEAQNALADMRSAAERYIRVRLASNLLRRYMDQYREQNQGPVLRKASELFYQLTLGSFKELQTDYNDSDDSVLYGIRNTGARVEVEGMIDGTRDILYLALRLASLHNHLNTGEPIPFIVDDILVNLDDQRAAATFKALAELSQRTQVIFFSHHKHLRQLAEATIPTEILAVHTLNRAA